MSKYAKTTTVPVERSRAELGRILDRYGCEAFGYMSRGDDSVIQFEYRGTPVRLGVKAGENPQETRQRWRILLLWVKATIESVEVGLTDFETAFAMHTMLPDGRTVSERVMPGLDQLRSDGEMPKLLLGGQQS